MNSVILLIGDGSLACYVKNLLLDEVEVQLIHQTAVSGERIPNNCRLAIVASDGWTPNLISQAEEVFHGRGFPWIPLYSYFGSATIGPIISPDEPGCSQCAMYRRIMADGARNELWQLHVQESVREVPRREPSASLSSLHVTALLCVENVKAELGGEVSRLRNHVLLIDHTTLETSLHYCLPNPHCPVCGQLSEDKREDAILKVESTPKPDATSFRTKPMSQLSLVLERDYYDTQTGLLNQSVQDLTTPFAAVSFNLPLPMGDEGTAGRDLTYSKSRTVAILEGLERHCGILPRGKRTALTATYQEIRDVAMNPKLIGLHDTLQYETHGFPFRPYTESTPYEWVWAYSLIEEQPKLVPLALAYYSLGHNGGFVYETSNGCALGNSLVEAMFHGILEVVERDGFLMTWYGRLRLPEVLVNTIPDREVQLMISRLGTVYGYEIHFYNSTMENGIPCVFALAKNRRQGGANVLCAAGAHVDPVRAIKGAIHELAGMVGRFDEVLMRHRSDYLQMLVDPLRVTQMIHHPLVNALPEAQTRFDFLLSPGRLQQSFEEAFPSQAYRADLKADVMNLLERFRNLSLDVVVVNQTGPEIQKNGLYCVKVIIPGMLPMTFGHKLIRIEGLHRVFDVPYKLGYAPAPLTREELNPHPHPFC